jgi:5-hydroxyisourate hydrolase
VTTISTHILDTALGRPAAEVPVALEAWAGGGWQRLGESVTGSDGRIGDLPAFEPPAPPGPPQPPAPPGAPQPPGSPAPPAPPGRATCRLVFAVRDYLVAHHGSAFFAEITVAFAAGPGEHYHVPLLLAPYGYSVYRGS